MLTIGEFANSTGISIKTLRYYHDIGLLPAAEVDSYTGYRSYQTAQIKDAVMLRVLRAAGIGIEQLRRVLAHPHELDDVLQRRREELAVQRRLEDWALDQAPTWVPEISLNEVQTRDCEPTPWVGVEAEVDLDQVDDDDFGSGLEDGSERLGEALTAQRVAVTGDFWVSTEADRARPSTLRVAQCCGLARPLPAGFAVPGLAVVSGTLPARTEAYVTAELSGLDAEPGPDALLPGGPLPAREMIALAMWQEQTVPSSFAAVRQRTTMGEQGQVRLELSVSLD